jgi:hypothetical protein
MQCKQGNADLGRRPMVSADKDRLGVRAQETGLTGGPKAVTNQLVKPTG